MKLGVDVVDLDRFAAALERTPRLVERVFTGAERAYCERANRDSVQVERFAVRFAAKEAVLKVFGVGLGACRFQDIEVVRAESGAPSLALSGRGAELAHEQGIVSWDLSLSHSRLVAIAVVAGSAQ